MIFEINNSIKVLRWQENITLKNIELFRQHMNRLVLQDCEHLILNLAGTNYINSAGLGIIADSVMNSRKNQKELVLVEIDDAVKEIFSIVKFTSFMKIFQTEGEAVDFFMVNQDDHERS